MRLLIAVERLLPALLWPLLALISYAALATTPFFTWLGVWWHSVLIIGFGYAGYRWVKAIAWQSLWPSVPFTLAQLERTLGIAHHPCLTVRDKLSHHFARRATSSVLWALHQESARQQLQRLRPAYRLRLPPLTHRQQQRMGGTLAACALIVIAFSDSQRGHFLPAWHIAGWNAPLAVTAWIEPPAYTGAAPIRLGKAETVTIPAGSQLFVQTGATAWPPHLQLDGESMALSKTTDNRWQLTMPLPAVDTLSIQRGLQGFGTWRLQTIPDNAPIVTWQEPPSATPQQAIALRFDAKDDYGVTRLTLFVEPMLRAATDTKAPRDSIVKILYDNPKGRPHIPFAQFVDLTRHPLAGEAVVMSIEAQDALGQTSRTDLFQFILPERTFTHPVAKQIAEVRNALRRDSMLPDEAAYQLFNALNHPSLRVPSAQKDFLALSAAVARLRYSRHGILREGTTDLLFDIAVSLDTQQSPLAKRQLDEAFKALQDALLDPDTSAQERARLFQEYQQALMAHMMQMARQAGMPPTPASATPSDMTSNDLMDWLEAIQDLQRLGDDAAALEQLQRLQAMMQNLQVTPPNPQAAAMQEQLQQLGNILNQQNALQQHAQQQRHNPEGLRNMQAAQQQLAEQLQALAQAMRELGFEPPAGLESAGEHMGQASEAMGEGQGGQTIAAQQQAINAMQSAMQSMMQQLEGMGQPSLSLSLPMGQSGQGRGMRQENFTLPAILQRQQAQEILDELRNRANDPERQGRERDYLHRLLDLF